MRLLRMTDGQWRLAEVDFAIIPIAIEEARDARGIGGQSSIREGVKSGTPVVGRVEPHAARRWIVPVTHDRARLGETLKDEDRIGGALGAVDAGEPSRATVLAVEHRAVDAVTREQGSGARIRGITR